MRVVCFGFGLGFGLGLGLGMYCSLWAMYPDDQSDAERG